MKYEVLGYIVHKILFVGYESEFCVYIYTIWNFNAASGRFIKSVAKLEKKVRIREEWVRWIRRVCLDSSLSECFL